MEVTLELCVCVCVAVGGGELNFFESPGDVCVCMSALLEGGAPPAGLLAPCIPFSRHSCIESSSILLVTLFILSISVGEGISVYNLLNKRDVNGWVTLLHSFFI